MLISFTNPLSQQSAQIKCCHPVSQQRTNHKVQLILVANYATWWEACVYEQLIQGPYTLHSQTHNMIYDQHYYSHQM